MIFSIFCMELKRALRWLPQLLLGAIVLLFLMGTIAFCSQKLLYANREWNKISIALVLEEDSQSQNESMIVGEGIDFVSDMDSTSDSFRFEIMEKAEAYTLLEKGEIAAIMLIPTQIIDSILDGTNLPVQIVFPEASSLSTALLQELTTAGAKTLSSAQAGIYVIADLYIENNLSDYLQEAYNDLNIKNLNYALVRDELFRRTNTSVTGNYSVVVYYIAVGVVFFLFLWGTTCSQFMKKDTHAFYLKLAAQGIKNNTYLLIKLLVVFLMLFLIACILFLPILGIAKSVFDFNIGISIISFLAFCEILLCIAAFIVLTYQLMPNPGSGILFLFASTVLMLFLSGGFIPAAFFPASLKQLSDWLPTTQLIRQTADIISGGEIGKAPLLILLYTLLFYFTGVIAYSVRKERGI